MDRGSTCGATDVCTKASGENERRAGEGPSRGLPARLSKGNSSRVGWTGSVLLLDPTVIVRVSYFIKNGDYDGYF